MGKVATSTSEQITLLKNRGMSLDIEESKVKEILHDIGYYRLGFYWNPFEIDRNHNFKEGTKFSDVVSLYYFDVDLRKILSCYINRIEINFRSNVIYYISNKYKDSTTWFIDPNVVEQEYINNIDKQYNNKFINENKPIKYHHAKYINDKYAPAWKTLEFFNFGAILKLYSSIKNEEIQKRISSKYGVENVHKFKNLINTIVFVRNACAHGNVLFDLKTPKGIAKLPYFEFNNNNRHSLDSTFKVILFILDNISSNRKNDLQEDLDKLMNSISENNTLKQIIEGKLGYKFKR